MWKNKRHEQQAEELKACIEAKLADPALFVDVGIQHSDFVWVRLESDEQETFIDIRIHFKDAVATLLRLIREEHSKGPKP
jgi:hypothetical protein